MSFWVGLVVIVLVLEAVRIGLSSYLLIHILRAIQPANASGERDSGVSWTRERDRLASEAMVAVRHAMDDLASPAGARAVSPAITALDAYVLHHIDRERI